MLGEESIDPHHASSLSQLTPLGHHLAALPTDVRIGKFLLLGAIFGVTDEALTIAAILSSRSPFLTPFDKRDAADAAKVSIYLFLSIYIHICIYMCVCLSVYI